MRRFVLLFFLLFCTEFVLRAVGAYPYEIQRTQPDGSVIRLRIRGDERFHYYTTVSGLPVRQGADGYYYVADLLPEGIVPTRQRVGSWSGVGVLAPHMQEDPLLSRLRQAAYEQWDMQHRTPLRQSRPTRSDAASIRVLVIPVEFNDVFYTMEEPDRYLDDLLNGDRPVGDDPSVRTYFEDNLRGQMHIDFDVVPHVTLPRSRKYYGENASSGTDPNVRNMVADACRMLVRREFDFSQYDQNQDGEVDYLFIHYAGHNEAEAGVEEMVWPHSGDIRSLDFHASGVLIGRYSCTSELRGATGENLAGIGTFCHEFAHLLGLVDLYDTDGEVTGSYTHLWGPLALMNQGAYNNEGRTPPALCAIDLDLLGLMDEVSFTLGQRVFLEPVGKTHQVMKLNTPNQGEYFLVEMRNNLDWDAYIGGRGMLVYHIDKSKSPADGIQADVRWKINRVNGSSKHPCANLLAASRYPTEVPGLFFPGSDHVFSLTTQTRPPLVSWQGQGCGVGLDSILLDIQEQYVTFTVIQDQGYAVPRIQHHYAQVGQQEIRLHWYTDIALEAKWQIEWRTLAESVYRSVTVSEKEYTITQLVPNEVYVIRITPRTDELLGETYSFDVKTQNITAPFPAIQGLDKPYHVGDQLLLKVHNLTEAVEHIRWLINGRLVSVEDLVLTEPGPMTIQAEVTYLSDHTKEYLYKVLHVLPREEVSDEN